MKKIALLVFLSCLFACGGAAPTPATARAETITVLAKGVPETSKPPAASAPDNVGQTVSHVHWSIDLPAGWVVKETSETGMMASRTTTPPMGLMIIVRPLPADVTPLAWVVEASTEVIMSAPKEKQLKTQTGQLSFKGHTASVTSIVYETGFLIGAVAVVDEKLRVGYLIASTGAAAEGGVLAEITKTFTIK